MFGIGQTEMVVLLVIVLIIFGPKNLPKLARSMGAAIKDFKAGLSHVDKEIEEAAEAAKPVETEAKIESAKTPESAELDQRAEKLRGQG